MNATADTTVRPDDYQEEARDLSAWLHRQAEVYRRHAPALTDDIERLQNAGALLDSFQAGLVPVTPHPLMAMELIRWVSVEDALPDADETVLIWAPGDDSPWPGYLDGDQWRSADGFFLPPMRVTHWAAMPAGPAPTPAVEARHEEAQP